ncbi:MAG: copper chaperone PCu(A)C [Gammaproteobacteria bacterium]
MRTTNVILALLVVPFAAPSLWADLEVDHAWIRAAPPGVRTLAGYANLTNTGQEEIIIQAVESEVFELIEMHETQNIDGVSSMHWLKTVEIAPGEILYFEPHGRHFMLIKPTKPLPLGVAVTIELILGDDVRLPVDFVVRRETTQ